MGIAISYAEHKADTGREESIEYFFSVKIRIKPNEISLFRLKM